MPSEPTTEAGKALLRSDFDTTGWGPRVVRDYVTDAIILIEAEAAQQERERLRTKFLRLLTEDSETKDGRRRDFNQAIFNPAGWAIWDSTDLDMVMSKFDKAMRDD